MVATEAKMLCFLYLLPFKEFKDKKQQNQHNKFWTDMEHGKHIHNIKNVCTFSGNRGVFRN